MIDESTMRWVAECIESRAVVVYPEDIFIAPTSEHYAEINDLLFREFGHKLDGIAGDIYRRAHRSIAADIREGRISDFEPGDDDLTCEGCGTTYDATDADTAGRCVHGNLCRACWSGCDRGRACRDGCHERGER